MFSADDRVYRALAALVVVLAVSGAMLRYFDERPEPLPESVTVTPASEEQRWTLGLPIRINRASRDAIELLPNIGPKRAEAISIYGRMKGGFRSVEDLDDVRGIGPKTLDAIRPLVTLDAGLADDKVTIEFMH